MQFAGVEDEGAEPSRAKRVGVVDDRVPVVVVRGKSGGRQCSLLHQRVAGEVAVFRGTQEPLRLRGLRPVETN